MTQTPQFVKDQLEKSLDQEKKTAGLQFSVHGASDSVCADTGIPKNTPL